MLNENDIVKIAKLARIGLNEEEKKIYVKELDAIIGIFEQLQEVNTDNVTQLTSISDEKLPWREDKITDGNMAEEIVKNAPISEYNCFVVPKVVE